MRGVGQASRPVLFLFSVSRPAAGETGQEACPT